MDRKREGSQPVSETRFPRVWDREQGGYVRPGVKTVARIIQENLKQNGTGLDPRKEARRIAYGYQKGEIDRATLERYVGQGDLID